MKKRYFLKESAGKIAELLIDAPIGVAEDALGCLCADAREEILAEIYALLTARARARKVISRVEFVYIKPRVQCKLERSDRVVKVVLRGESCIAGDIHAALCACDDLRNIENAVHGKRGYSPCTTYKCKVERRDTEVPFPMKTVEVWEFGRRAADVRYSMPVLEREVRVCVRFI